MNMHCSNNTKIQIKSNQIIQLILQYLYENKFTKSFNTLQQESKVTLNQINSIKQFNEAFKSKNWSKVINQIQMLMLPEEQLIPLFISLFFTVYQFIIDSLIQYDQYQAAQYIIQEVIKPNIKQISLFKQKIMRMQYLIQNPTEKNLYKNPPTEARQLNILKQISFFCIQVENSRLIKLLSQSLKYQVAQGVITPSIKLNLFSGIQKQQTVQQQTVIKQIQKTISYTEESKITQLKISWSQEYLAIGGVDGLIQLYNTKDYSLYDNDYQRQGQMFFHDHPISIIQFNYTDQMLASVDSTGLINIWNLKNGKLLRKIQKQSNINAICWGVDPSHLLIGYKQRIKVYGIRSCNILKQFVSNLSQYILSMFVTQIRLYIVSTNGSLNIFNYTTQEQLFALQTKNHISSCFRLFKNNQSHLFTKFMLAFKKKISQIDEYGTQIQNYMIQDGQIQNSIGVGQFIYVCIKGSDNKYRLSLIERKKKKVIFYISIDSTFQFMIMSRKKNLLITYDGKHKLSFWRPN